MFIMIITWCYILFFKFIIMNKDMHIWCDTMIHTLKSDHICLKNLKICYLRLKFSTIACDVWYIYMLKCLLYMPIIQLIVTLKLVNQKDTIHFFFLLLYNFYSVFLFFMLHVMINLIQKLVTPKLIS